MTTRRSEFVVSAFDLTNEQADALFDAIADFAHSLDGSLQFSATLNAHLADERQP